MDGQVLFQLTEKELMDIIEPIGIVKSIMSLTQDQVLTVINIWILYLIMVYRAKVEYKQNLAFQDPRCFLWLYYHLLVTHRYQIRTQHLLPDL